MRAELERVDSEWPGKELCLVLSIITLLLLTM